MCSVDLTSPVSCRSMNISSAPSRATAGRITTLVLIAATLATSPRASAHQAEHFNACQGYWFGPEQLKLWRLLFRTGRWAAHSP
jgi:hypothetical protein